MSPGKPEDIRKIMIFTGSLVGTCRHIYPLLYTSTRTSANSYDLLNSIRAETEPDTIGGNTMTSSEYPATKEREDTVCAIEDLPEDYFLIKDDHLSTVLSMYNILVVSLRYEYIPSHL